MSKLFNFPFFVHLNELSCHISDIGTVLPSTRYLQNTVISHIGKTFLFCDAHSVLLFLFLTGLKKNVSHMVEVVCGRFLDAIALSDFASCFHTTPLITDFTGSLLTQCGCGVQ